MLTRSRAYVDPEKLIHQIASSDLDAEDRVLCFETEFSEYLGGPSCFATNQARAALFVAFRALNISKGDEIVVPSFTFKGVVDPIIELGGTPVLVDSSLDDLNAHAEDIEKSISDRTRAIVATHLFGIPTDINAIKDIASDRNCYLIEDCAQCLGATYGGKKTGTFGDMAIVSFNFEKHMSTGEGGMLVVNNQELLENVREITEGFGRAPLAREKQYVYGLLLEHIVTDRDTYSNFRIPLPATFGQECCMLDQRILQRMEDLIQSGASVLEIREALLPSLKKSSAYRRPLIRQNPYLGTLLTRLDRAKSKIVKPTLTPINSDHLLMNSMRAMVGKINLSSLDEVNRIRNENARLIYGQIKDIECFALPVIDEYAHPCFLKYNLLNRSPYSIHQINRKAREAGLELGNYQWGRPIHLQEPYRSLISFKRDGLRNSEHIASCIINLPVHYCVSPSDIDKITQFLGRLEHPE